MTIIELVTQRRISKIFIIKKIILLSNDFLKILKKYQICLYPVLSYLNVK